MHSNPFYAYNSQDYTVQIYLHFDITEGYDILIPAMTLVKKMDAHGH